MHLTVSLSTNYPQKIAELRTVLKGSPIKIAAGTGVRKSLRVYLRNLGPNKRFPDQTTGFYKSAAHSITAPEVEGTGVSVSITQIGMRQRYFGGTITPKDGKKFLTIPAQGFAYGRLAGEFTGDVKFALVKNAAGFLAPALIAGDGGASISGMKPPRRKKGQAAKPPIQPDQVIYWLVRSVTQAPDPSVLPTPEVMQTAAVDGMRSYVRAKLHDPNAEVSFSEDAP